MFFAGVNGASTPGTGIKGVLNIGNDVADVAASLQQSGAGRG
ncbi:hypothetical protein [Streptomyces sp. NPDC101150]